MENAGYLLAAFIIIWAVVFGYIIFMQLKQRKLGREIELLKDSINASRDTDK
jgi:CcmD family protein